MKYNEEDFYNMTCFVCAHIIKEKMRLNQDLNNLIVCFTKQQLEDYKKCLPNIFVDDNYVKIVGHIWKIKLYKNPFENMNAKELKNWLKKEN